MADVDLGTTDGRRRGPSPGGLWARLVAAFRGGFGLWNVRPARELGLAHMAAIFLFPLVFTWVLLARGYSARARILGFGWLATVVVAGVMAILAGPPGRNGALTEAGGQAGGFEADRSTRPLRFEEACRWRQVRPAPAPPILFCRDADGRMAVAAAPAGFTRDTPARAEVGDLAAMEAMGRFYVDGPRRLRNGPVARDWFRRAADRGDARAMLDLGLLNGRGKGVDGYGTNLAEAARWYQAAADRGEPQAMYMLAGLYRRGQVYPRDDAQAANLYQAASDKGYAPAMSELGFMYDDGLGVAQDPGRALRLYQAALAKGDPAAMFYMGVRYQLGRGVPYSPVQARRLYQQAAAGGLPHALVALAMLYRRGLGGPADDVKATALLRQAADSGQADAMYQLGLIYRAGGRGVPRNEAEAVRWFGAAADAGFTPAQAQLRGRAAARG